MNIVNLNALIKLKNTDIEEYEKMLGDSFDIEVYGAIIKATSIIEEEKDYVLDSLLKYRLKNATNSIRNIMLRGMKENKIIFPIKYKSNKNAYLVIIYNDLEKKEEYLLIFNQRDIFNVDQNDNFSNMGKIEELTNIIIELKEEIRDNKDNFEYKQYKKEELIKYRNVLKGVVKNEE
ncbi:MAG: hypothetical protein RSD47_00805 [Romboutsia sp.]